jgi:hypothetical protein
MRLLGKHASISIGAVKVGDAYDVTVKVGNTFEDVTAHGDDWEESVPLHGNFSLTAKKYAVNANLAQFIKLAADTPEATTPLTVTVYQTDTTTKIFEGTFWSEDGDISLPVGKVEENLSLKGTGTPAFVGTVAG